MKHSLATSFVFAALVVAGIGAAPAAHAESTEPTLSSLQALIKNLQEKIASLQAQIGKVKGGEGFVKKFKEKREDRRHSTDDGSDVEVEIEDGKASVTFTVASSTYTVTVAVSSTTEAAVLKAVADKLGVAVSALDAELVSDIKAELARKLDKKGWKIKNKIDKKFDGNRRDVARHIIQAEREIAKAKADGASDTDLADAKKLLADAKTALEAKKYKEAKELAKDARESAKDWDEDDEDDEDEDDEDEDDN